MHKPRDDIKLFAEPYYKLPDRVVTRVGYTFDPSEDSWEIYSNTNRRHYHFGNIGLTDALKTGFKGFIASRLSTKNPNSVYSEYSCLRRLLLSIAKHDPSATTITSLHLVNFRASLNADSRAHSTEANRAVRVWAKLGIPGVSKEAFATAADLPKHKRKRGLAVKLRCPDEGAYSNLEFDGLFKALHGAFACDDIALDNYALCLLSGAISPRPIQIASLRVRDLKVDVGPTGKTYRLSVPRAKQRGAEFRTLFTDRPLVEEIGMVIEAQARLVYEQARRCGLDDPEKIPLFPAVHAKRTFFAVGGAPTPPTAMSISARISSVMEGLRVRSERTGKHINANATRARRTAGTRAAREGKSLEEIAAILDHATLTAAHIYVEVCSELLQNLDKKVAMLLAPMAQRFAGAIIPRGDAHDHDIQRHVFGTTNEGGPPDDIGGCGKQGYCQLGKPIACYTCRLFRPWLDGPHEAILDGLLDRRTRIAEIGSSIVAAVLDDTIIACAEVVRQCQIRNAALGGSANG